MCHTTVYNDTCNINLSCVQLNFILAVCWLIDHIVGVMVIVFVSRVIERTFKPQSCQTNDYNIGIGSFSIKYTAIKEYE